MPSASLAKSEESVTSSAAILHRSAIRLALKVEDMVSLAADCQDTDIPPEGS